MGSLSSQKASQGKTEVGKGGGEERVDGPCTVGPIMPIPKALTVLLAVPTTLAVSHVTSLCPWLSVVILGSVVSLDCHPAFRISLGQAFYEAQEIYVGLSYGYQIKVAKAFIV